MLILTDFSEQAFRAAEYACELAGALNIKRIIVFHAYQPANVIAVTPEATPMRKDNREVYLESMESLALLQDRLKPLVAKDVNFGLEAGDTGLAGLPGWIRQKSQEEEIGLIVMGVSGNSGLEKFLVGSTTAEILQKSELPVLIVPEDTFLGRGIQTIVFTADLTLVDTIPVTQLFEFLDAFPGKLHVVNADKKGKENYSPEMQEAITKLHNIFEKYDPAFNYITGDDTVDQILAFARQQQAASLIITVHEKKGFMSRLFNTSVTKKLAYNSNVPLLSFPAVKKK